MELLLKRHPTRYNATIGVLQVAGAPEGAEYLCDTLEDPVREVVGQPVSTWKVQDDTAIPAGRFRITLVDSPRFGPDTLSLLEVPGFMYIRIHAGNVPEDTDGCILVGLGHEGGSITNSRQALAMLKSHLVPALKRGEPVWLTVQSNALD